MKTMDTFLSLLYFFLINCLCSSQAGFDLLDSGQLGEVIEYCPWEDFNATCGPTDVILMKSAHYGRMRMGNCIKTEVYIGCSGDVLGDLDQHCSGQQSCLFNLPDESLHRDLPCPVDLMAYLEASYACVPVATPKDASCNAPKIVTGPEGYIANALTDTLRLGTHNCPWRVEVQRGQRINITLLDFTISSESQGNPENSGYRMCNVYANIKENLHHRETNVCGGQQREQLAYTSDGHVIDIYIISTAEQEIRFLLHYTAIGCPDPLPPKDAWFTREAEKATIRCNHTSQTWHVVCKGNSWFGDVSNCSAEYGWGSRRRGGTGIWPPYGLLAAVIIGVILGIVLGLGLLGLVLMCRRRHRRQSSRDSTTAELCATYDTKVYHEQAKIVRPSEQGYTHVWELRSHRDPRQAKADTLDLNMQKLSMYHDRAQQVRMGHEGGRHGKDHIYESPKFEQGILKKGDEVLAGPAHFQCPHGGHHCGTMPIRKKPDMEMTSDESEEDLEVKPANRKGYRPVPAGTLPRREPPKRFNFEA